MYTIKINQAIWRLAVMSWLLVPALAWGRSPLWWATLTSCTVIALGLLRPSQHAAAFFGWVLLGCVGLYLVHAQQPYGSQRSWMAYVLAFVVAAAVIAERGSWGWLRQAMLICAWVQVPVMVLQGMQVACPWMVIGGGVQGTLGRRWILSAVLALASLWSSGRSAWVLGISANLTGSLVGLPALVRLVWRCRLARWALLVVSLSLTSVWIPRVLLRWEAWQGAGFLRGGWLTGWGFLPLPGGFAYDGGGVHEAPYLISDYHNAFLDWVARGGLPAAMMLLTVGVWLWSQSGVAWQRWTLMFAGWVGCWQSLEAAPFLILVMLAWWVGVVHRGGSHALDSV